MASSQQTDATDDKKYIDAEELSIDDNLLGDVYLEFGQDDEDSVFDQPLLQYLNQHPIVPPPPEAKYNAAFVESVLKDIQSFKEENNNFADSNESVSRHAFVNHDEYAVEQPRYYQGQENNEQAEVPIRAAGMNEQGFKSVYSNQPSHDYSGNDSFFNHYQAHNGPLEEGLQFVFTDQSLSDSSAKCSYSVVFLDSPLQADQVLNDKLYNDLFEDESNDFSPWFCFDNEDETVQFIDDIHSAVETNNEFPFSPEYPLEQTDLEEIDVTNTHTPHNQDHRRSPVETFHDSQNIQGPFNQMEVTVNQRLEDSTINTSEAHSSEQNLISKALSSTPEQRQQEQHHKKRDLRKVGKNNKPAFKVHISKADFMSTATATTTRQKRRPTTTLNNNNTENLKSDVSFPKLLVRTSTPTEQNTHQSIPSNSRVLSQVDNQQETISRGRRRSGGPRRRNSSGKSNSIGNKEQDADEVPKRTFNLRRKC